MVSASIILQDVKPLKDQMDEAVKTLADAQKQLAIVTAKVAKLEQDLAVLNADLAAATKSKAEAEADVSWHRQRGRRGGWKRLGRACAFFHVCARISCALRISCARFLRALRLRASFAHFLCAPYMTVVRAFLCTRLTSCHLA